LTDIKPLNIFYQEPDPDRWIKYDHFPRKIIRSVLRGKPRYGGQFFVYYNLVKGLAKAGIPYRVNNFKYVNKHNNEIACVIGKDQVLYERNWKNPVVFGPSFGINPVADPDILKQYPIKKLIVPCLWLKDMFAQYGSENIEVWPVGIDTDAWMPGNTTKKYDFLIYNKIRWDHKKMDEQLIEPIKQHLTKNNLTYTEIKYGHYKPDDLKNKLSVCRYAIFLCEHETQGIAYQQMLSSGVPLLAWDRGGYWQDPNWYPDKINFQPVSSVPYWDEYCGVKFISYNDFGINLSKFMDLASANFFKPRDYILKNLTLEKSAVNYFNIIHSLES
jgi:hypothetical protein